MGVSISGVYCSKCKHITSFSDHGTNDLTCEQCNKIYDSEKDVDPNIEGCIILLFIGGMFIWILWELFKMSLLWLYT